MISLVSTKWFITLLSTLYIAIDLVNATTNLTCYQCVRTTKAECSQEELLPCPSSSDRCVTHIMKDETTGFKIKRECGLGPCSFNDLMMSRGLGLDTCDRSRKEYFCLFCCKENGCNKDSGTNIIPSAVLILFTTTFCITNFYNVFKVLNSNVHI